MKKRIIAALAGFLMIASIVTFGMVFSVGEVTEVYEKGAGVSGISGGEIATIAGIKPGDNILGINETAAIKKVSDHFPDNSVDITDIERVFPNKVIITVEQRIPIAAIAKEGGAFALADIDFQLDRTASEPDFSTLVSVPGLSVKDSFNTPEFRRLREALLAVLAVGFPEESIPAFVKEITFSPDTITYALRSGGTLTATGSGEDLIASFATKYAAYLALSDAERALADL